MDSVRPADHPARYWARRSPGRWQLVDTGSELVLATATRLEAEWVWWVRLNNRSGTSTTLDAAMLAVGRARSQP